MLQILDYQKETVLDAMRHWEADTCIRFHPRPSHLGGVLFFRGPGLVIHSR